MTVNYDTDGTPYMTVTYTYTVDVIASNEDEARIFAPLAFNDQTGANPDNFIEEVL